MKLQVGLALLVMAFPAFAGNTALYDRLESMDFMQGSFVAMRTAEGVDFNSKARMAPSGHPRYHIEIEGPLQVAGADSLPASVEAVILTIEPEVDTTYREDEDTRRGLNISRVDVNGVEVAYLSYRNAREADTFCRRAVIHTSRGMYVATMSLHGGGPRNRMGMYLDMLVIDMVNSGLLQAPQGRVDPPWLKRRAK